MINKQYITIRILLIMVVSLVAFGTVSSFQCFDSFADEPTVSYQGDVTSTITIKAYTDNTLQFSGTGSIPSLDEWQCLESFLESGLLNSTKTMIIGEGITETKRNACFYDNDYCFKNLERVEFPSTLVKIGNASFGGTLTHGMLLKELVFSEPGNLTTIGSNAFIGCSKIEEIIIPEGVTTIDNYAFQGCAGLKHISFPSTITSYGASVLYGCTNMETITFNALQAAPLSQERTGQSGEGYIGFDTYIYNATNPASNEGCLRKENGHDVVMRHPVGAKGYSDDDPAPTDGWAYYIGNTWETFSILPEEVQAVIDAIYAIDDPVTLESEGAIAAAREAYDKLSEEYKAKIDEDTLKKLTDAERTLKEIKAKPVKEAIAALPKASELTLNDKAAVEAARVAYDALSSEAKEYVDNITTLELAEATIAKLEAQAELAQAKEKLNEALENAEPEDDIDKLAEQVSQAKEDLEKAGQELKNLKDEIAAAKLTVSGLKVTSKSRRFTVTWKKNSKASGYQVQYRGKGIKKFSSLKTTKLKVRTKKLKKDKKYQFRVRTYTKVDGTMVYGKWSKIKTIKCNRKG